jgi:hypothetical protein
MNKPLAKSLHTITVLVRVARTIARYENLDPTCVAAMKGAVEALGLSDQPDIHNLFDAALKQIRKYS